jgi:hypothetical protein
MGPQGDRIHTGGTRPASRARRWRRLGYAGRSALPT